MAQPHVPHRFDQASSTSTANRLLIWFSVGALLLSLPLLFNIVSRAQSEARMHAEVERMTQQVNALQTRLTSLHAALDYAQSDAFVEEWARVQARWSKAGEVVVVPPASREVARPWWEDFLK